MLFLKESIGRKVGEVKIYFMHVPKTAGTAFNAIFRTAVPSDRYFQHMESNGKRFAEIKQDGMPFYASGHFTYLATKDLIKRSDVFSLTILRNPVSQLVSHLKWVKAYGRPESEARRALIPDDISQLSVELWNTSLNDVDSLKRLFERPIARRLFDNLQVRYMTNTDDKPVSREKTNQAIDNFKDFDFIFTLDDIDVAVRYLKERFPNISDMKEENKALIEEKVDFSSEKVLDFYRFSVRYDAALYTRVRNYSRDKFFSSYESIERPQIS
jgi:hypothetical protein